MQLTKLNTNHKIRCFLFEIAQAVISAYLMLVEHISFLYKSISAYTYIHTYIQCLLVFVLQCILFICQLYEISRHSPVIICRPECVYLQLPLHMHLCMYTYRVINIQILIIQSLCPVHKRSKHIQSRTKWRRRCEFPLLALSICINFLRAH